MRRLFPLGVLAVAACHSGAAPHASDVLTAQAWQDADRHPFSPKPGDDAPTRLWDGLDHTVLRPTSQFFAVRPGGEAADVNALDEVPTSSWFTNRIGLLPMSPDEIASGPCTDPPLDTDAPMVVQSSKLDGVTPGFVVKSQRGTKYLIKLDDVDQTPRPTAADAIASRIYYAAGYTTPCNRVVFFERSRLTIAPRAELKTWTGAKTRFEAKDLDLLLTHASRLPDGRYRALASQWLDGQPIGPWRYEDVRPDDPNDVIPHEDRREVRGVRLLAAWLDNTDSRAQNTLDVWMPAGHGTGWIRHTIIDFSDCFGAIWTPTERWRRMGHAYLYDLGQIGESFVTLGIPTHPWESAHFGPAGKVFGYYDIDRFDPEAWRMETPNTAFSRMTEHDAAWMARIIAQFGDRHLERVIRSGRLGTRLLDDELFRVIRGRRDRILRRYLGRVSPLSVPIVSGRRLCMRDLAVFSGIIAPRSYAATMNDATMNDATTLPVSVEGPDVCVTLPVFAGTAIVDVTNGQTGALRIHVRGGPVVAAVERL